MARGLLLTLFAIAAVPATAGAADSGAHPGSDHDRATTSASTTRITVRVTGLPKGQQPRALLRGPGLRRHLATATTTLRGIRPGRYALVLEPLRVMRGAGPVRAGARASASRPRIVATVRRGGRSRLTGVYDTVVNPVTRAGGELRSVAGPAENPTAIVLAGRRDLSAGEIVSIAPSADLPHGLLARVDAVRRDGGVTRVAVHAASVFEVAPSFRFDVPLEELPAARPGAAACEGASGISPYRRINGIRFSGGWNTQRIFGHDVPIGVEAFVHFNVEAGLDVRGGVGVSCSKRATFVSASGMAGPIPVTASIEGELTAFAAAGGKLTTGGSVRVDAGAKTVGVPPLLVWAPQVTFGSPRFDFKAERFAEARAGIGLNLRAGLGNGAASATVSIGASTELSAKPGNCAWDARFGQFGAQGKLLGWTIDTPKTPPLFSKNLWRASCGGGGGGGGGGGSGPRPAPGPSPTPTPPPTAPPSGDSPIAELTAVGSTTGPGGMNVAVRFQTCPHGLLVQSGALRYMLVLNAAQQTQSSLITVTEEGGLPAGSHDLTVVCMDRSQRPVWHDPAFRVTITRDPQPVLLESSTAVTGGELVFRSGASLGPSPCPEWPGHTLDHLTMHAYIPTGPGSDDTGHSSAWVALPSGTSVEPLQLTGATVPGRYFVDQSCWYSSEGRMDGVYFRPTWVEVS